jgi:hypothetical protein
MNFVWLLNTAQISQMIFALPRRGPSIIFSPRAASLGETIYLKPDIQCAVTKELDVIIPQIIGVE